MTPVINLSARRQRCDGAEIAAAEGRCPHETSTSQYVTVAGNNRIRQLIPRSFIPGQHERAAVPVVRLMPGRRIPGPQLTALMEHRCCCHDIDGASMSLSRPR